MTSVLFVDDELQVLEGIEDMLRSKRSGWAADFALGGQELPFVAMIPNAVAVALLPTMTALAQPADPTLAATGKLTHSYPHSWRSKKPVIFRATPQWFVAIDKPFLNGKTLRQLAMKAIEETRWYPPRGQNRIGAMVEGRPDWVLSRQRA